MGKLTQDRKSVIVFISVGGHNFTWIKIKYRGKKQLPLKQVNGLPTTAPTRRPI